MANQNPSHISAEEFARKYKSGALHPDEVIDVREPEEWRMARLENCKFIPMGSISERIHELDPEQKIYVMCAHGIRSLHVVRFLSDHGFADVVNVDGGLAEVSLYLEEGDLRQG
ncbi:MULTISPECIES: rhodanese-like domain-containing protein [unclassified Thermoactinomyces]|jgi:rhodanese-related sulfurtransferase|uniref:rhodanese-like domain-containing protein n=1 Tax=unclassified Thermoactinomyces TaxID=2634588 RepID=UPI0018DC5A72|nr:MULTISPECIES: rhodanese-like domain-containing protein [unclassified Thermoactinomyces]MBH8596655.1 rhodanese-like domain-containing protein [Thermoactinomyces sp. CICC 10523]MBH8603417.1 rhodanese-like domain-containing protein [Thermoactinomyces sp. CICC 10522]